jgi:O-acetyl-ADP-ribose deacetylase (regulator of RNase III)
VFVQIVLTAALTKAWQEHCGDVPGISIQQGSLLDVACDAVVSPANSFGFMDGGIDAAYMSYFGPAIQTVVRQAIHARHGGELLVGAADIVETGDATIPFLIAAPTMRVPMILHESVNPYLAARAVLLLIARGTFPSDAYQGQPIADHVKTVAFPGLGTGVGRVKPEICAYQFRQAFNEVQEIVGGTNRLPLSWSDAVAQHRALYAERRKSAKKERLW